MPLDLRRLYDEHASSLFAFSLNLTRNESDTRELLQELFLKLAVKSASVDGVRDVRAWLIRLIHHLFGMRLRCSSSSWKVTVFNASLPALSSVAGDLISIEPMRPAQLLAMSLPRNGAETKGD